MRWGMHIEEHLEHVGGATHHTFLMRLTKAACDGSFTVQLLITLGDTKHVNASDRPGIGHTTSGGPVETVKWVAAHAPDVGALPLLLRDDLIAVVGKEALSFTLSISAPGQAVAQALLPLPQVDPRPPPPHPFPPSPFPQGLTSMYSESLTL